MQHWYIVYVNYSMWVSLIQLDFWPAIQSYILQLFDCEITLSKTARDLALTWFDAESAVHDHEYLNKMSVFSMVQIAFQIQVLFTQFRENLRIRPR